MKKLIGALLIVVGLMSAYMGINKVSSSGESVELLGVELSAEDIDQKLEGYLYLWVGIVILVAGAASLRTKE